MVRKLLKYDLGAYFRVLGPAYLVLAAIAVLCRVIQFFEPAAGTISASSEVFRVTFISSVVLLVLASIVVLVLTFAQIIIVFYRNLFTREGYLTHTLPVSAGQHIAAKLAGAFIVDIASTLAVALAACIAMAGEMLSEVLKAAGYLVGQLRTEIIEELGRGHFGGWVTEFVLLALVSLAVSYLFYYLCITLGQRAKKNRILAAFGVFFAFYIALQILTTIFVIVVSVDSTWLESLMDSIVRHAPGSFHLMLCGGIVVGAAIGVAEYLIVRNQIARHLNLE